MKKFYGASTALWAAPAVIIPPAPSIEFSRFMEMAKKGIHASHQKLPYLPLNQFPTPNNTGTIPGVARTSSGTVTCTANNQVVQNLNITGQVIANGHTGCKVFNCQIDGNGTTGFGVDGDSTDISVINCEIFNHGHDVG